jgi:hypothetical protein
MTKSSEIQLAEEKKKKEEHINLGTLFVCLLPRNGWITCEPLQQQQRFCNERIIFLR